MHPRTSTALLLLSSLAVGCGTHCGSGSETEPEPRAGYQRPGSDSARAGNDLPTFAPPGTLHDLVGTSWTGVPGASTYERIVIGESTIFLRVPGAEVTVRSSAWEGPECAGYPHCVLLHGGEFRNAVRHLNSDGRELRFVQCVGLAPEGSGPDLTPSLVAEQSAAELAWEGPSGFCLDFRNEIYRRETATPIGEAL